MLLKPSNILLVCDRQYSRHCCVEEQNINYKYTVSLCFPWEEQTLHFLAGFFFSPVGIISPRTCSFILPDLTRWIFEGGSFSNEKFCDMSFLIVLQ